VPKDKVLAAIHPSAAVEAEYRKRLLRLTDEMARSCAYWLRAAFRANEPEVAELASDADPADVLRRVLAELQKRWQRRFDEAAEAMADHFAKGAAERSDAALKASLRKAGFTVKFKPTAAQRDIMKATVQQNVSLIRSIPAQYLTQVEGSVMRAVQVGGDLGKLTAELQKHHGVTRRRAAFIARDQNSKANAALKRARQLELGIVEEEWRHHGSAKRPRPSHVKAGKDRVRYKVETGWFDPDVGEYVWPGSLIGCQCIGRPVIPGL
jgi:uncharacterized protein with gpF-like domain